MENEKAKKLEELQKFISEIQLEKGDVITVNVGGVVAMTCCGSIMEVTDSAMLPLMNFFNDVAKQHIDAPKIVAEIMILQLVAGLHAVLEHCGVNEEDRAKTISEVLTFPLSNAKLLTMALSTAEDFLYNLPREVKANINIVSREESLLEKIKRHLS